MVELTRAERDAFDEIASGLWVLRLTRGRLATLPTSGFALTAVGLVGLVVTVGTLSLFPVVVSFAGFVVTLASFAEFTRSECGRGLWRRTRALLGVELDE